MFKSFLYAIALVLSGSATILTASGMVDLFSGLWFLFITIDIARFFVTDYLIKSWKYIGIIKYFTTSILLALLFLSSVGVYNSLDQRIPKDMHESIMQTASINRQTKSNETAETLQKTNYDMALKEYESRVSSYDVQKNACLEKENSDKEQCIRTYNANILNAKKRLDTAQKEYMSSIENTNETVDVEVKNKTEIAGILTTICSFTGGKCDTTDGLLRALRIIILLIIIGLEIFSINILFIIHSHKQKEDNGLMYKKLLSFKLKRKNQKEKNIKNNTENIIKEANITEKPDIDIQDESDWDSSEIELNKKIDEEDNQKDIIDNIDSLPNINTKIVTFEDLITVLKQNPKILETKYIKDMFKKNPILEKQIKHILSE